MSTTFSKRWQGNFWAGLAIVLPGVISIAVLLWLFKNVATITDTLLFFLPKSLTHENQGAGPMYWYWSVAALALAVFLIGVVGLAARNYFGRRLIEWVDAGLLRVPLLNKIYGTLKQVNDAFSSGNKTAFRTVVLVEFPRAKVYSIGFVTSEQQGEVRAKMNEKIVCVFVPTTPNPTSGFLILLPEDKLIKLEMSVADGIKYLISLGSIVPQYSAPTPGAPNALAGLPLNAPGALAGAVPRTIPPLAAQNTGPENRVATGLPEAAVRHD